MTYALKLWGSKLFSNISIPYFFRKYLEFTHEHEEASRDVDHYLSNPLNGFLLVKRLTVDWKDVEASIKDSVAQGMLLLYL